MVDRIIISGRLIKDDITISLGTAGMHYYLIGTVGASVLLEDIMAKSSSSPDKCQIVIAANHIFESDTEHDEIIGCLLKNETPVYSTNSDRFVNINGNLQKTAGYFYTRPRQAGVKIIEYGKPNAEIFRKGLEAAGCSPADACMIGDSLETDIEGARNSGIKSDLLEGGGGLTHTEDEIRQAIPDFIINVGPIRA
ncbi:HAD-IA family hydrolase (plasmid) [Erwinia sp. E602]|uniref:HAD-IA family hydrolase n=1 Tax=Erwinia sp. E602 TaxID=2675378 RepID=UPI001BAC83E3|nr:HAD-IA family hydrolase [Erwinia sp. E602]QUG73669.1 HAD-IA family hydrolase [Erwinia sp. E602]